MQNQPRNAKKESEVDDDEMQNAHAKDGAQVLAPHQVGAQKAKPAVAEKEEQLAPAGRGVRVTPPTPADAEESKATGAPSEADSSPGIEDQADLDPLEPKAASGSDGAETSAEEKTEPEKPLEKKAGEPEDQEPAAA